MKKIVSTFLVTPLMFISLLAILNYSCKKSWLEAKPSKNLVVPSTIADFQSLLDNTTNGNAPQFNAQHDMLGEIGAADFYLLDMDYEARIPFEQNVYRWLQDIYGNVLSNGEWDATYKRIFYSNIVLEGIEKVVPTSASEQIDLNRVKGSALFLRAFNHYSIAQLYCKVYDPATTNSDLGIPLRTESDINIPSVRSSVQKTYDQILSDLKSALALIPTERPFLNDFKTQTRPNKAAVCAMLARVYLSMSNYDSAFMYSDRSLQIYNRLMDFNNPADLNPSSSQFRIPQFNMETLFYNQGNTYSLFSTSRAIVDSSSLYVLYSSNDLRGSSIFIRRSGTGNNLRFFGSYTSTQSAYFTGLATDEVYIIRAECYVRKGDTASGLNDLNTLYKNRWNNAAGPFQKFTATSEEDALRKVLAERRKELCFRNLRWTDLRRLNIDPRFAVTLTRRIRGQEYQIFPNSPSYVLPIPPNVIQLTEMEQNSR